MEASKMVAQTSKARGFSAAVELGTPDAWSQFLDKALQRRSSTAAAVGKLLEAHAQSTPCSTVMVSLTRSLLLRLNSPAR
jgi:hypothetical protein